MKNQILTLMLSAAVCTTSPCFAVQHPTDDVSQETTPPQKKGGLYLADPIDWANKPCFRYQKTPESERIRQEIDTTRSSQLKSTYPEHFTFYERSELSGYECHKYALAKLFDYEKMPEWIFYTLVPSLFKYDTYLKPTVTPKKGDLVVYFEVPALIAPTHFGIYDGVDRVISTWGKATDNADRHAPFFTPSIYGKYIVFYTSPEGTDFKSIRNGIEKQNTDKVYSKVLGDLEDSEKESVIKTSDSFITANIRTSDIETILRKIKQVKRDDREGIKDLTLSLIDGKVNMIESVIEIFEEISKIDPKKRGQAIADAKIISFNRMTGYDFAQLQASSKDSFYMNGCEISSVLKTVNDLEGKGDRPEILEDAQLIINKLQDRDISEVIEYTANLPSEERSSLITSTMALIKGKVLWNQVKDILRAMRQLLPEKWQKVATSLKERYRGDTNGSYFVYQYRSLFEQ